MNLVDFAAAIEGCLEVAELDSDPLRPAQTAAHREFNWLEYDEQDLFRDDFGVFDESESESDSDEPGDDAETKTAPAVARPNGNPAPVDWTAYCNPVPVDFGDLKSQQQQMVLSPFQEELVAELKRLRTEAVAANRGGGQVIEYTETGRVIYGHLAGRMHAMPKMKNPNVWLAQECNALRQGGYTGPEAFLWPPLCVNTDCDSPCTLEVGTNSGAGSSFVCGNCGTVLDTEPCFESELRDPHDTLSLRYTARDETGAIIAHDNMQREDDVEQPYDAGTSTTGGTKRQQHTLRRWLRRGDIKTRDVFLARNSSSPAAIAAGIRSRVQFLLQGLHCNSPQTVNKACSLAAAFTRKLAEEKKRKGGFLLINRAVQYNNIAAVACLRAALQYGLAISIRDFVRVSKSGGVPCTPRVLRSWYSRLVEALELPPVGDDRVLTGFVRRYLSAPGLLPVKADGEAQLDFNRRVQAELNDAQLLSEWAVALQPRDVPDYRRERRTARDKKRREAEEKASRTGGGTARVVITRDRLRRADLLGILEGALSHLRRYTSKHGDFLVSSATRQHLILGHTHAVLGAAIAYTIVQRRASGRVSMQAMEKLVRIDKMSICRAKRTFVHFLGRVERDVGDEGTPASLFICIRSGCVWCFSLIVCSCSIVRARARGHSLRFVSLLLSLFVSTQARHERCRRVHVGPPLQTGGSRV